MRDEYKDICDNYEALKKEYNPTTINGKEYFVPWLSMFPKQNNVSLLLKVKQVKGNNGKVKKDDVVKLPTKHGIRFEPNEVRVKDIKENGVLINVFCDSPLSSDTEISLLNKNDATVGKIMFFKNDEIFNLNLKIVKVVRSASKKRDLTGINKALEQIDLDNFLNKNSLQQALIKTAIIPDECVLELDGEILNENGKPLFDGAVFVGGNEVSSLLRERYMQEYEQEVKHKGLLLFVTPIKRKGAAGDGQLWAADHRNCSIFYDSLYTKTTYAHELAHVLGCEHPFDNEWKINNERFNQRINDEEIKKQKYLSENEEFERGKLKCMARIEEMKTYPNNPVAIKNIEVNKSNLKVLDQKILAREKKIKINEELIKIFQSLIEQARIIKESNRYVFPVKGITKENFMDYVYPKSNRKSFWKWQWRAMQYDIKTYYS
ncbi:hypothetical protein A8C32_16745 [Flavivirga aquatica]|uniref:Uncharacterized protein n=1 Tax=Flavivirga aquatica TaxID=1849968 RepID=A0A1E5T8K1_9FLAO|nr:hypothetical protein [Flavivirga aquatica]OEK07701.1 hypothetical protein A8C32_16745 [Flavivirga aquatica]